MQIYTDMELKQLTKKELIKHIWNMQGKLWASSQEIINLKFELRNIQFKELE